MMKESCVSGEAAQQTVKKPPNLPKSIFDNDIKY